MPHFIAKSGIKISYVVEGKGNDLIIDFGKIKLRNFQATILVLPLISLVMGTRKKAKHTAPFPFPRWLTNLLTIITFSNRKILLS